MIQENSKPLRYFPTWRKCVAFSTVSLVGRTWIRVNRRNLVSWSKDPLGISKRCDVGNRLVQRTGAEWYVGIANFLFASENETTTHIKYMHFYSWSGTHTFLSRLPGKSHVPLLLLLGFPTCPRKTWGKAPCLRQCRQIYGMAVSDMEFSQLLTTPSG